MSLIEKILKPGRCRGAFYVTVLACVLFQASHVFGQVDSIEEDPDRRRILAFLQDLQDITPEKYSQLADAFDAAWSLAVRTEDPVLNLSTDQEKSLEPGTSQLDAGARYRLTKVFQQSPEAFRAIYRDQVRSNAESAFQQALKNGDLDQLEAVLQRFQFTEVANQGLEHLIQLRRSRGEFLQAALLHGRWMSLNEGGDLRHRVLQVKLWCQAGLAEDGVDELHELIQQPTESQKDTLKRVAKILNSQAVDSNLDSVKGGLTRSHLRDWLNDVLGPDVQFAKMTDSENSTGVAGTESSINYLQPLGNSRRAQTNTALLSGDLKRSWDQSMFSCLEAVDFNDALQGLADDLQNGVQVAFSSNDTVVPIATPIAVGNRLIFRCAMNLRAVDLKTGEPLWESFLLDRHLRSKFEASQGQMTLAMDQLNYRRSFHWSHPLAHWILNNTAGQLTTDGRTVFAVEEVLSETQRYDETVQIAATQAPSNYLRAYDVETGRLRAQAGGNVGSGRNAGNGLNGSTTAAVNPLAGMYFLGAPLVLGDRIYVIAEAEPGIYLLQLKATPLFGPADEFQLQPVFSQLLSIPRFPLRFHPLRNRAGIVPSFGRGLIICSTCDEHIIAVSAADHSVRWIYRYPTIVSKSELGAPIGVVSGALSPEQSDRFDGKTRWTDCLPRIVGDRIVVTPRDSNELLCLDLQTGEEVWTMPRGDYRTVTAVDETKVVVAGARVVSAFSLSDGRELWSTKIPDGRICGSGFSDGAILQLPTSRPGILAIRLSDGQQLLHQSTDQLPGNLFTNGDAVISQNVTSVQHFAAGESTNQPLIAARSQLIQGNLLVAIELLREAVQQAETASQKRAAQDLFVAAVLNAVRANDEQVSAFIPEAEAMLVELRSRDDVLGLLLASGFGIPPITPDVQRFSELERADFQWAELQELVTLGRLNDKNQSPEVVARRMMELLQRGWKQRENIVRDSQRFVRKERLVFQQVRTAIEERDELVRVPLKASLQKLLAKQLNSEMDTQQTRWWMNACLMIDVTAPAATLISERSPQLQDISGAFQDLILRRYVESSGSAADVAELMDRMEVDGQLSSLVDVLLTTKRHRSWQDRLVADRDTTSLLTDGQFSEASLSEKDLDERLTRLLDQQADLHWAGTPNVVESDAHSVTGPAAMDIIGSVTEDLPVFDSNNQYRHWNFVVETSRENGPLSFELNAYDARGQLRWNHPLGPERRVRSSGSIHPTLTTYVVARGQLVLVRRASEITMLDCSQATPQVGPKVLWSKPVSNAGRSFRSSSWERTTVYDRQPTGLTPVGPISRFGLPIIYGNNLLVVDPVSGSEQWQAAGLSEDCTLTIRDDRLYVISQASSQIEIRSLIDGHVIGTNSIPDWWRDAEENSTTTARYFELDNNDSLPFRLQVFDGNCVLYRYGLNKVVVESFDLNSSTVNWSRQFPGQSAVSNVCGGVVAVLSNDDRLQLVDLATGAVHKAVDVSIATPDVQYLYLRRSGGRWIVITDQFETDHDDHNTVNQAVIVNGAIHGLSENDGSLSWSQRVKYQWVRIRRPVSMQPAIPPVVPILTLLSRPSPRRNELGQRIGRLVYHTQILDVRTGQILYQDDDMGYTLSNFYMKLLPAEKSVVLNFDKRSVTFDYSEADQPGIPASSSPEPR